MQRPLRSQGQPPSPSMRLYDVACKLYKRAPIVICRVLERLEASEMLEK